MNLDLILKRDTVVEQINNFKNNILAKGGVNQAMVSSIEHMLNDNIITKDTKITQFTHDISSINQDKVMVALESYKETFLSPSIFKDTTYVEYEERKKLLLSKLYRLLECKVEYFEYIFPTEDEAKLLLPGYEDVFNIIESPGEHPFTTKSKEVCYREYVNELHRLVTKSEYNRNRLKEEMIKGYCAFLTKRDYDFEVKFVGYKVEKALENLVSHYTPSVNPVENWYDDYLLLSYFSYKTKETLTYDQLLSLGNDTDVLNPRENFSLSELIRFFKLHNVENNITESIREALVARTGDTPPSVDSFFKRLSGWCYSNQEDPLIRAILAKGIDVFEKDSGYYGSSPLLHEEQPIQPIRPADSNITPVMFLLGLFSFRSIIEAPKPSLKGNDDD